MATTNTINTSTLVITESEVRGILNIKDVIQVVETAFREKGNKNVQMPPKTYLTYPTFQGDLRVMPCYLPGLSISGVKIVNVHPNNFQYSIPTVMAAVILVDVATGIPKSIMGGTWLTAMRTGAASAVATNYLAKKNAKTLGLVGAGVQAITQTLGILQVRQIEEIFASSMHEGPLKNYLKAMEDYGITEKVKISVVKEPRDAVENIDVVCTTTPARKPAVEQEWVKAGTHINAIGADAEGKQELEEEILHRSLVVIDDFEQATHSGEVNVPLTKGTFKREQIYAEIGEIVTNKKPGRTSDSQITIFDSTGLGIQDAVTADLVYKEAIKKQIGNPIQLVL